uniref:LITAF domain-containing protein n=1 Tax=Caenorhabditis tropicalis TaxID=1561998 RepID=A0A1I7TEG2_9PELO
MTINPTEYTVQEYEDPPLTPTNHGKVQFLGPDTVRYISPPRVEVVRQRVRPVAAQPPPTEYSTPYPPPSYQSSVYPNVVQHAPPQPTHPQMVPVSMPMMNPQYMVPQMAPMITQQPQMLCMPTMQQPVIAAPVMTQMSQMLSPVQLSPPQIAQPQQTSPAITLCINQSPQSNISPGGTGGALICPKCRKGIITRQQDKFRKRILFCLALCCCPITCGLPLLCICCNYVDTCGACGKKYGHRGKKQHKTKVNAVKI